jgi:hypothetical protein
MDFQSIALPTELPHHFTLYAVAFKRVAKVAILFSLPNISEKIFNSF